MFVSKSARKNFVDILELMCRKTGISEYSLGVMIRSYHFAMPVAFIFILLFCDGIIVYLSIIYYILIVTLFILFDGCFISMLENRLCNDKFNMIGINNDLLSMPLRNAFLNFFLSRDRGFKISLCRS